MPLQLIQTKQKEMVYMDVCVSCQESKLKLTIQSEILREEERMRKREGKSGHESSLLPHPSLIPKLKVGILEI